MWSLFSAWRGALCRGCLLSLRLPGGGVWPAEAAACWELLAGNPSGVSRWAVFDDSSPTTRNLLCFRQALRGQVARCGFRLEFCWCYLTTLLRGPPSGLGPSRDPLMTPIAYTFCPQKVDVQPQRLEDFAVHWEACREPWLRLLNTAQMPSAIRGNLPRSQRSPRDMALSLGCG